MDRRNFRAVNTVRFYVLKVLDIRLKKLYNNCNVYLVERRALC